MNKRRILMARTGYKLVSILAVLALLLAGLATSVFAGGEDYKHWADKPPADWQNGALQSSNSQYFEDEVVPHYFKAPNLTSGTTYAFNIYYDYYQSSSTACGFNYLAQYNIDRTTTFVGGTPSKDPSPVMPEAPNNYFYTVGADITSVSAPVSALPQRYIQVKFTATAGTAYIYWGLHLALPNANGTGCLGAHAWTGASLQTNVSATPSVTGATMIGGGGTMQINPSAVIPGSISGYKWEDLNGNGSFLSPETKLSGWTIQLYQDPSCATVKKTTTTDTSGNYIFSIKPGTYYVKEVLQLGWAQTAPSPACYGPINIAAGTPTATVNFGNWGVDLELTKDVEPDDPDYGEQATFTIVVTNQGPGNATGVQVQDIYRSGPLTYGSVEGVDYSVSVGNYNPTTQIWVIGDLAVGASATLYITVTASGTGYFENVAEVIACDQPDDSTPANFVYPTGPNEDDDDSASGNANPTAVTLFSFAAKSSAGGLPSLLWLSLAGLTVLAAGGLFWAKRRNG